MYGIRNRRTKKWLYGTWWQDGRTIQRTSFDQVMTWEDYDSAKLAFRHRRCGKDYEIVPIKIVELEGKA